MCALLDDRQAKLIGLNDTQKQMVRQLFLAGGVSFNAAKESKEARSDRATFAVLWFS